MLGTHTQYELLKSSWDRKKIITSIISTSKSLQTTNFIILFLWTSRDQIFSWFPLKESIGCLLRVAAHTPTIEIPQVLSWHHHMVPLKNWTKIQNRRGECDLFHFIISPCSQNPWSSHYPACTFFSEWTHCTLTLRPPSCQRWCHHNNHSWNPWHIHHLPCIGPYKKNVTPPNLFLCSWHNESSSVKIHERKKSRSTSAPN
jgi:hypothetical protein